MALNSMSLDDYANMLAEDIKEAVRFEVVDTARDALIKFVNQTVYENPQGSYYSRTFELLNAIEIRDFKVTQKRASFTLGFNNNKIQPSINPNPRMLNWHTGVKGGFDAGIDGFIDTLENGASGSPIYNHPAHGFMDKTASELEKTMVRVMANALKRRGWKVSIF